MFAIVVRVLVLVTVYFLVFSFCSIDLAFNNEYQTVLYYDRNGDSADLTLLNPEDQIEDTHSLAAAGGYAPAIILNKYFFLQQKSGTAVEGGSVTAGDKIGTITVTISPDTKPITE